MFGFLKQKLSDFGNKLKETLVKEEDAKEKQAPQKAQAPDGVQAPKTKEPKKDEPSKTQKAQTPVEQKKETKVEEKKPQVKKEETKTISKQEEKTTKLPEIKKEEEQKLEKPIIKAEEKNETIEEKKTQEIKKEPEKKGGILSKILGFGKKETPLEKKEQPKKKTKEEMAEELERKMFAEIEEEIKKEEKENPTPTLEKEVVEEEYFEEKKEIIEEKKTEAQKLEKPINKTEEKNNKEAKDLTKNVSPKELDEIEEELKEEDEEIEEITSQEEVKEKARDIQIKSIEEDKRELKANVGVVGGLKGFLFGGLEITEKQIEDMLFELELSLIESDVEQEAATEIVTQIKKRLVGTKVSAKNIDEYLKDQIKEILASMMKTEQISLLEETKKHKPLVILILGPNGAGKTTSIAKLVHYFKKHKKTCVVAAADTFRAGAIHQIEEHASKLDVRVIKHQYGADPAAVAFDAIKAAEANKLDVVLIDSAGRQETNKNLMEELRKIERVAKPNLKIYVGEAYVGQTLLEQVAEFEEIVGIDGFILTKIDTDAKGGTAISLLYKTKKPIIFVGTGQGYDDFKEFTPEFILERII